MSQNCGDRLIQGGENYKSATVEIENIGGIDRATAEFDPGVTILTGQNATNRTSFLQAIMAVLGSDNATLKADAERGQVTLDVGETTYSRYLERGEDEIIMEGNPYLDDPALADLFAFLLETNECRQAIIRGDNLREIIMEPVNTDEIEQKIRESEEQRDEIDSQLAEIESIEQELPELRAKRDDIAEQFTEKREALEKKQEELDAIDESVKEKKENKGELEEKIEELSDVRDELNRIRHQIDSEKESIEALEAERDEVIPELEAMSPVADDELQAIEQQIQRLHGQINALGQSVSDLQSVIQFNEEMLDDDQTEITNQLSEESPSGDALTDKLVSDSEAVTCWTCGSTVNTEGIKATLDELRSLRQQKVEKQRDLEREVNDLQDEKQELDRKQENYQGLQRQRDRIEQELGERKESLEDLRERQEELSEEIDDREVEVEDLKDQDYGDILSLNEQVNKLEYEQDQFEADLREIEDEINEIETQVDERDPLQERREDVQSELTELRSLVEDLQNQAIDEFNDRMETVLNLLEYDNIERIWIDRTRDTVREGRRTVEQDQFDLHVVRSTESGTVFEDSIEHLSESEREVTGLVFALAGYLVHDVHEILPFMLLDSIESIDSGRIAQLVNYLEDQTEYLVVVLLEEDAQALGDRYQRIANI